MLIQNREPHQRHCRTLRGLANALELAVAVTVVAGLRLDAAPPAPAPAPNEAKAQINEAPAPNEAKAPAKEGDDLSFSGTIRDKVTGQPIEGARVTIRRVLMPDPKTGQYRELEVTQHLTDAEGSYRYTVSPDQAAQATLSIGLDVEHPAYAPPPSYGTWFSSIRKAKALGEKWFLDDVRLVPGKAVTGQVELPDGKPARGVRVITYSQATGLGTVSSSGESLVMTETDAEGRFRAVLTTPGLAILWLLPDHFAASIQAVPEDNRGDLGRFVLQEGTTIKGQVLDVQGQPLAGLWVNAERARGQHQGEADELLIRRLPIQDYMIRSAKTNERGEYELSPLPPGKYQVAPGEFRRDHKLGYQPFRPLPAAFAPLIVTLKEGEATKFVEFRAVPHVVVDAQALDGQDKPIKGGVGFFCAMYGWWGDEIWNGQCRPDPEGKFTFLAPRGLERAQLHAHSSDGTAKVRHRLSKTSPLIDGGEVKLGTLGQDFKEIEIIRDAPAPNEANAPAPNEANAPAPNEANVPVPNKPNAPAQNEANIPAPNEANAPAPNEAKPGALSYTGKVKDRATGKPIEGALVTVQRGVIGRDKYQELQETKHTTDADGSFPIAITPEQAAEPRLNIVVVASHPDYAPIDPFGERLAVIRRNEAVGGRPGFEDIGLWPGQPISGQVRMPDGTPAKGVKVFAASLPDMMPGSIDASYARLTTDLAGNFRAGLVTPGLAAFWLMPENAAAEVHTLRDGRRGELGVFTLKPGIIVKGRVLDEQGKPVAGASVRAHRRRSPEADYLHKLRVSDVIYRTTETNANGEFNLAPLPEDNWRVSAAVGSRKGLAENVGRKPPLAFEGKDLTLKEGETPVSLVIRALPVEFVVVEAQWLDSQGKPTRGYPSSISGSIQGEQEGADATPTPDGKIVAHVRRGLVNAVLILTTDSQHVTRYRMSHDGPLKSYTNIKLGTSDQDTRSGLDPNNHWTLDQDVKGIEIIRYLSPTLAVKGETKDHKPVPGLRVTANYTDKEPGSFKELSYVAPGGGTTDVLFKADGNGAFISSQLFPDREAIVTAQADGYKPSTVKIKLPEGKAEELVLVLERDPAALRQQAAADREIDAEVQRLLGTCAGVSSQFRGETTEDLYKEHQSIMVLTRPEGERPGSTSLKAVFTFDGKGGDAEMVRLDPMASPKHWDWVLTSGPLKDQTAAGIYRIEGDTLTIGFQPGGTGAPRPVDFRAGEGDPWLLDVYHRQKP